MVKYLVVVVSKREVVPSPVAGPLKKRGAATTAPPAPAAPVYKTRHLDVDALKATLNVHGPDLEVVTFMAHDFLDPLRHPELLDFLDAVRALDAWRPLGKALQVSFIAPPECIDDFTGFLDAYPGAFTVQTNDAVALTGHKSRHPGRAFGVNYPVTRDNLAGLPEFCGVAKRNGYAYVSLWLAEDSGLAANDPLVTQAIAAASRAGGLVPVDHTGVKAKSGGEVLVLEPF